VGAGMPKFVMLIGTVISIVNIALFFLWWSLIRIEAQIPASERSDYLMNALSVQITVLEVVMAAVAIGLAIVGVFGYQTIRESAVEAAVKEARKETQKYLNIGSNSSGAAGGKSSVDPKNIPFEGAEREEA